MKRTRETIGNYLYFTYSVGQVNAHAYELHFEENEIEGEISAADLNVKFFETLFKPWRSSFDIEDFLEFQFENTEYPQKDFINHIRHVILFIKKIHYSETGFSEQQDDIQQRVFKWLDKKYASFPLDSVSGKTHTYLSDIQLTHLIKYFFEALRDSQKIEIVPSDIVRLLHAITGRPLKIIQNSTFLTHYKRGFKSNDNATRDLKRIEVELARVHLTDVLPYVREELNKTSKKIQEIKSLKDKKLRKIG